MKRTLLYLIASWGLLASSFSVAEEASTEVVEDEETLEEVVVIGRYKAAATDVVSERMDAAIPMDMLDAEAIGRVGDSDVASALRRMPGLTLVQDKFVYVRGLGERYSSAQLISCALE